MFIKHINLDRDQAQRQLWTTWDPRHFKVNSQEVGVFSQEVRAFGRHRNTVCHLGTSGDCGVNCHCSPPSAPVFVLKSEEDKQETFWMSWVRRKEFQCKRPMREKISERQAGAQRSRTGRMKTAKRSSGAHGYLGLPFPSGHLVEESQGDPNTGSKELEDFSATPLSYDRHLS